METAKKNVAVVLHGMVELSSYEEIRHASIVIAADGAAITLIQHKITPDICIGDFDSMSSLGKKMIEDTVGDVRKFPPEKDATDGELALCAGIECHPDSLTIYGAIGGRIDHMLGIIFLLETCLKAGIDAQIVDGQNIIRMIQNGTMYIHVEAAMPYVSVIPISDAAVVTLEGFVYPLTQERLNRVGTRGISNELRKKMGTVTIHEGIVLCIQSADRYGLNRS